jgi:VPDSG-CTERM motif
MKTRNITKWLAASVVFGLLSLATQRADAVLEMSYTTDSPNLIGTSIPGLHTGGGGQAQRDADMANTLLQMSNLTNNQQTLNGSLYSRTTLAGGPAATTVGAFLGTGFADGTTPISIDLSQTGTFNYLVVSYDGPTAGSVAVFNIAGLTGVIQVYRYAKVELDSHGNPTGNLLGSNTMQQGYKLITSYTLLNPTGVPDGGATVMLLGAGLGALGMVRRYLTR